MRFFQTVSRGGIPILIMAALVFTGCSQTCGTCKEIEKNEDEVATYLGGIAKAFSTAEYEPADRGNEARITFYPSPTALDRAVGGARERAQERAEREVAGLLTDQVPIPSFVTDAVGRGATKLITGIFTKAEKNITCEANPTEVGECEACPKTPKISFSCGDTCGEVGNSESCQDAAKACFEALLQTAIDSHQNNRYREDVVLNKLRAEYDANPDCQSVQGLHSECKPAEAVECSVHEGGNQIDTAPNQG